MGTQSAEEISETGPPACVPEQEEDFVWDGRPHPMCIPHIVDNILRYLNISDLKSCRLLNSQYNEIGCRNLARKEVITFNKFSHLSSYLRFMPISSYPAKPTPQTPNDDNTESTDPSEEDALPLNNEYAHTSFHFNFDPSAGNSEEGGKVTEFFETFGPTIRELRYTTDLIPYNFPKQLPHMGDIWKGRLGNCETLSFEMKWGIPSSLYEKEEGSVVLPNVRRLNLDILVTEREADRAAIFLRQLLASTPNVEEISIPGNKKFFDDYVNVVLGRIILSSDLPRLSTLNFCLALSEPDIRALAEKGLPLKSLILDFAEMPYFAFLHDENNNHDNEDGNDENGADFLPFLQNQALTRSLQGLFLNAAGTLKDLHLCFPYNPAHSLHRFLFPESMVALTHLALGGFYGSVTILDRLPVLKKLDLWNVRFHDFDYEGGTCKYDEGSTSGTGEGRVVPNKFRDITTVIS